MISGPKLRGDHVAESSRVALEQLREEHAGEAIPLGLSIELMGQLEWSAEKLAAERLAGLRSLVRYAKERSPFYARCLARLDPSTVTGKPETPC